MARVSAEAVAQAVNAANTVRIDNGEPIIEGLPADAIRENESECVLAKLFNFDCEINGYVDKDSVPHHLRGEWFAEFSLEHAIQAQQLGDALGTGVVRADDLGWGYGTADLYVPLPAAVAEIAEAFDAGELDPADYEPTHTPDGQPL